MSRDFYELCYDQYKQVAIPLLGTLMVTLGRVDILAMCFIRVDVFLFYLAFFVAAATLVVSVVFLFLCAYPRQYKTLASMDVWHKWRLDYQKYISENEEGEEVATTLDTAMFDNLCPKLAEAQPVNAKINEKRRKAFQRSVLWGAITLAAIGVQAFFSVVLTAQGV